MAFLETRVSLSQKLVRNTAFNVGGGLWRAGVYLCLTPYIFGHLGQEQFGVWAIATLLTGYLALLDLGIESALVKEVAYDYASSLPDRLNVSVSTAFLSCAAFCAAAAAAGCLLTGFFVQFLDVRDAVCAEAVFPVTVGFLAAAFRMAFCAFSSLQLGLQCMHVHNGISTALTVPLVLGTVFFLEGGYGIRGLMLNSLIFAGLTGLCNMVACFVLLPSLSVRLGHFSRTALARLVRLGLKMRFCTAAGMLSLEADRFFVAHFVNMAAVGAYQLGSLMIGNLRLVLQLFLSPLMPAASELAGKGDAAGLTGLCAKGSRYFFALCAPALGFLVACAPLIMRVWMGSEHEDGVLVVRLLGGGYLVNLSAGVAVAALVAANRVDLQVQSAWLTLLLNIALSLALVRTLGFRGVAIATAISLAVGSLWLFWTMRKVIGFGLKEVLGAVFPMPLLASAAAACGLYLVTRVWPAPAAEAGRLACAAALAGQFVVFTGIYCVLTVKIGYLRRES